MDKGSLLACVGTIVRVIMPEEHKYQHEKIQERLKAFDSRISSRREEVKYVGENQYQVT